MKLVLQSPEKTLVKVINERELEDTINSIKSNIFGYELPPLKYELFRYRIRKGVAVIYKDNKRLRSKNSWYEVRALSSLSQYLGVSFFHNNIIKRDNGLEDEIDGIDTENNEIMVEVKRAKINQEWINFYDRKRKRVQKKVCIVIAPLFEENLQIPPTIQCYEFKPDYETLMHYYNHDFSIPPWLVDYIPSRHVRVLLNNGQWRGIERKLTKTAKHTQSTKLILSLNRFTRFEKFPIKVYYSLCHMVMPVEEYFGKGYPQPRVIAAIDVDADSHKHVVGSEGYCLECLKSANSKAKLISEILSDLGWKFLKLYSGSKGFHFYLLQEGSLKAKQLITEEFLEIIKTLKGSNDEILTDNISFRAKDGSFDTHRIFKLPNSVDASTGIVVKENLEKLNFNDKIKEF